MLSDHFNNLDDENVESRIEYIKLVIEIHRCEDVHSRAIESTSWKKTTYNFK